MTLDRATLDCIILGELPLAEAVRQGLARIEREASTVAELFALLDDFALMFEVIEPKRMPPGGVTS